MKSMVLYLPDFHLELNGYQGCIDHHILLIIDDAIHPLAIFLLPGTYPLA